MIEWGLCCIFREEPIRFRRATAASLRPFPRHEQLRKLSALIQSNAEQLKLAFERCAQLHIGAFRINSELLMLATHADVGYRLEELPETDTLQKLFDEARSRADRLGLRRSLHPDQFSFFFPSCAAQPRSTFTPAASTATSPPRSTGSGAKSMPCPIPFAESSPWKMTTAVTRLRTCCRSAGNWKSPSPTTSTTTGSTPTILRSKRRPGRRRRRGTVERFRPMSTSPALNCRGESPATTGPTPTGSIRPTSRSAGAE